VQSQAEHKAQLQAQLDAQTREERLELLEVLTPGIKVGRAAIRHTTCAEVAAWGDVCGLSGLELYPHT
jgi:hypothetical protein